PAARWAATRLAAAGTAHRLPVLRPSRGLAAAPRPGDVPEQRPAPDRLLPRLLGGAGPRPILRREPHRRAITGAAWEARSLPSGGLFSGTWRGWPNPFTPTTPLFLGTLSRKVREIRNFTPPPPCTGYPSRCNLIPATEGGDRGMRIRAVQAVFDWAGLDDSPSLGTIRRCLRALPDAAILHGLRSARGRGRDDYPVSALWGVAVLTPLLRHPSHEACLAELRRNPALRRLIGIEAEEHVPHHWNLSRFLDALGHPAHLAA